MYTNLDQLDERAKDLAQRIERLWERLLLDEDEDCQEGE